MTVLAKKFFTPTEYLKLEERSEEKHEFHDGIIVPMAGGYANHGQIVINLTLSLGPVLKQKRCRMFDSNMRVQVKASGLYAYPDMSIVCGKVDFAPRRTDTITNPSVIVEVLSPSTRAYDQGEKFVLYRGLKSLQAFVLIDSENAHVEIFEKRSRGTWVLIEHRQFTETLTFSVLDIAVSLADIYDMVDWAALPRKRTRRKP